MFILASRDKYKTLSLTLVHARNNTKQCLPRLTGLFSCHRSGQYNIVVTDSVRLPAGDPTNTHTFTHSLTRVFCHVPPTKAKIHSTYSAPSLPIIAGHARM